MQHSVYLHGWCSGPHSNKAQFIRQLWQQQQLPLHIPDLNQPDFFHLTLSRQIAQVEAHLRTQQQVTLIGSSLGALTALCLAERCPQVARLILFAPAVNFAQNARRLLNDDDMQRWASEGQLALYHHAHAANCAISYGFYEDMQTYSDADLQRVLPTLVLHGAEDEVIPVQDCLAFATQRPWIECHVLNSDHSLGNVFPDMARHIQGFCQF